MRTLPHTLRFGQASLQGALGARSSRAATAMIQSPQKSGGRGLRRNVMGGEDVHRDPSVEDTARRFHLARLVHTPQQNCVSLTNCVPTLLRRLAQPVYLLHLPPGKKSRNFNRLRRGIAARHVGIFFGVTKNRGSSASVTDVSRRETHCRIEIRRATIRWRNGGPP